MLNGALEGGMEGWTLALEQWGLVRDVILEVVDDADPESGVLLTSVVATVQARLGDHPAFPGGRLTNVTRHVEVDLQSRGLLDVVPGSAPRRLRRTS